ncbi:hypothetical protein ACQY0O_007967 [Thecaphora frezii]
MLCHLPLELQAHVLEFLPARVLVKTIGPTSSHFNALVDNHVRRCLLRIFATGPQPSSDHEHGAPSGVTLEFEAQRPIDTVTAKHTLHFSHFAVLPLDAKQSAAATDRIAASKAVFAFSETGNSEIAGLAAVSPYARWEQQRRWYRQQQTLLGLADDALLPPVPLPRPEDIHRWRQSIATSSIQVRDRLQGATMLERNAEADAATADALSPFLRSPRLPPTLPPSPASGAAWSASPQPSVGTSTVQSLDMPLDAYDWQGPSGASPQTSAATSSPSTGMTEHAACYAFQLEPLDSFESLILTLSVRKYIPDLASAYTGSKSQRKVRYQRTVAEGLDRVFRDWFIPPSPSPSSSSPSSKSDGAAQEAADRTAKRSDEKDDDEEMPDSMSALLSSFDTINRIAPQSRVPHLPAPAARQLEFDTPSCTLTIRPHATPSSTSRHPAHAQSLDAYLSSPSLTSQCASLHHHHHDRVELTFHCECVSISSARLLSSLEQLEEAVVEAEERARCAAMRFPTLLAGGSNAVAVAAMWGGGGVWSLAADGLRPVGLFDAETLRSVASRVSGVAE